MPSPSPRALTREDLICITGSFYLVGEAKRYFEGLPKTEPVPQLVK